MNDVKNRPRGRARKILKFGAVALALLFPLLAMVHYLWLVSGTNEWKLTDERNGITIWTQKTPGNPLLKGRARFQVRSTLGGIIKIVYDRDVHKANNMMKVNFIEAQHAPGYFGVFNKFTQDMPWPFQAREFVLMSEHVQNATTKAIELNALAAPNKVTPSDCCVRIVHLHNRYTVTPRSDGAVDIEFFWDIDLGGAFPYALQNVALPGNLYKAMDDFRTLIAKYKNDTVDYIAEPGAARLGDMHGFIVSQQR